MQSGQSVEEWARTAQVPQPVRWGEIERTVLAWDLPSGGAETLLNKVFVLLAWALIVIRTLLTLGAPLVALVLIVIGAASVETRGAENWFTAALVFSVLAVAVQLSLLAKWWQVRRHQLLDLVATGGAVGASAASALVLVVWVGDVAAVQWWFIAVLLATGILGAIGFVLNVTSKPEGRDKSRTPPARGPRNDWKWRRYHDARSRVLDILVKRGVVDVDEADHKRLSEMPLGYWEELDGVDEKEWRRILELRSVGWRDFDESDARSWPPATA